MLGKTSKILGTSHKVFKKENCRENKREMEITKTICSII